ncbi:MAG TPA: RNA methyltransferase [Tepidisphaeraceae bacterium]|jgi:tRNA G18 (ribose-2'-O)-methylase SpoU
MAGKMPDLGHLSLIERLDDPRLDPYREMKDRDLARHGSRFIAESEQVVRRLLESDYPVESVLVFPRKAEEIAKLTPKGTPVYVLPNAVMNVLCGFKFHSGVLACGRRKTPPTLAELAPETGPVTLVVLPETNNTENLGMILRIAAGFGVSGMLLGEKCANPYYRQSIRVSMGEIFKMPIVQSENLIRDLAWLREQRGVELIATVVDAEAESLAEARVNARKALLFGGERHGLHPSLVAMCDRKVTIPMELGTDSLNVHVAAGIFLYEFSRGKRLERD